MLKLCECIWNWICEVHSLIGFSKIVAKLQLIGLFIKTIPAISLYKINIIALLLCPFILLLLQSASIIILCLISTRVRIGERIRFHTLGIEIPTLGHVTYIDFNRPHLAIILYFKVIPVSVSFGVCITSYKTIVLIPFNLNSQI